MNGNIALDQIDEEIIRQFQRDGRRSNRAIGEIVGLSEGAVRKRLKRLTESGAASYGVVVDIKATDMEVSGYLAVEAAPAAVASVGRYVSGLETCSLCSITTGKAAVRAYLYARDRLSLSRTTAEIAALNGVIAVHFREALYFTLHRYELIHMPEEHRGSVWDL